MTPGQGWCLECGTAAPGSLGGGPSWRQALTVVGLTLLIVGGAVAASYAALTSQSKRATTAPRIVKVAAQPVTASPVATTPPITPPTTPAPQGVPPAAIKPVKPVLPPKVTPTPTPKAVVPPTARPRVITPAPRTQPHTTPAPVTGQTGRTILLDPNAANTYNPYSLPDASFGDPSLAIDGDPTTAWTYQLDPATQGKTAVGLVIDLKTPQAFKSSKLHVTSPGAAVEFYGANGTDLPVSITDPAWTHLANRRQIKARAAVTLKTAGKTFRWLLIWIAHAPANQTTGTVGVAEVSVIR
jgi:hypothetical protein